MRPTDLDPPEARVTGTIRQAPPARHRAAALSWDSQTANRPRRSPARILGASAVIVVGGWLAAVAFLAVGSRHSVLAVARPLPRYHTLERRDLKVVRVAADADVATVPADRLDDLLGRRTADPLAAASLLNERSLLAPDERPVQRSEAVVGALLSTADAPAQIPEGSAVRIIIRAAPGSDAAPESLAGWVLDVADAEPATSGARRVSLVVTARDAEAVSAAAADDRVTVVLLGGG